ncbi:hypothetical protein [Emticicia fontis]
MNTPFYKIEQYFSFPQVKSALTDVTGKSYTYYVDKITDEKFYSEKLPIELVFERREDERKFGDFHKSGGMDTFDSKNTFIVSEKFKSILEQLVLPPHRFYPAIITTYLQGILTERTDYYVFHFLQDYFQEIDFNQSQFAVGWFGEFNEETFNIEQFFNLLEIGEIKSNEDYIKKSEEIKNLGLSVKVFPLELKFKKYYDVLSARFNMYFSEKAKNLVEENNITGIRFEAYNPEAKLDSVFYIPKIRV